MGTVAILAISSAGVFGSRGQTVDAGLVGLGGFVVTASAIDQAGGEIIVGVGGLQIGMATGAVDLAVARGCELGLIHEKRDGFASGVGLGEVFIAVTIQALFVGDLLRSGGGAEGDPKPDGED